jgi:trigger factor
MMDEEIHRMMHQYEERLRMQGLTLEQYFQFTGGSHDKFHEEHEEEAKKIILYRLMLEEIAKIEKIEATMEEAKEEAARLADKYQMTNEELINAFGGLDMIKYDVEMRKTIDFLKNNN